MLAEKPKSTKLFLRKSQKKFENLHAVSKAGLIKPKTQLNEKVLSKNTSLIRSFVAGLELNETICLGSYYM